MEVRRFPWIPQQTRFGIVYSSRCWIEIQAKNKQWLKRELKVDSGADATMLELCDLHALGYRKNDCIEESFNSANTQESPGFGHLFRIKIGEYIIDDVPILFSAKPIANLLLGRARIFEEVNVIFDRQEKCTIFLV